MTLCITAVGPDELLYPEFEAPFQIVGDFLRFDAPRVMFEEYLKMVRRVENGDGRPALITGNLHHAEVYPDHVTIRFMFENGPRAVTISTADFVEVLTYWEETVGRWLDSGRPKNFFAS